MPYMCSFIIDFPNINYEFFMEFLLYAITYLIRNLGIEDAIGIILLGLRGNIAS